VSIAPRIVRCIDLETCGLKPEDGGVCEVATTDLVIDEGGTIARGESWSSLCNPGKSIPPQASAIHHIVDDDVLEAPAFDDTMQGYIFRGPLAAVAIHHARFDLQWFKQPTDIIPVICTRKVALRMWPDAPSHANQVLRYWLKLRLASVPEPHRAPGDVTVTGALLRLMIVRALADPSHPTVDEVLAQMIEVSRMPAYLRRFHFGKHQGEPVDTIPDDYLQWVLDQGDKFDEDIRHTAGAELYRRRAARP
jgi:exodeoxyribonuclease X